MNEPNSIKHVSRRTLDNLLYGRELNESFIDLMHYERHLTEEQARETLKLFPDVDSAIAVANYFFFKKDIRKTFPSYNKYLTKIYQLVYFPEEKLYSEVENIFNDEVGTRGRGLLPRVLATLAFSSEYRKNPFKSSHQDEHFASQDSIETNPELATAYFDRRFKTGL